MRLPLLIAASVVLALTGCTTAQKVARAQKELDRQTKEENTRSVERRRMMRVENGEANSVEAASIVGVADPSRVFDPKTATAAAAHGYGTKGATTKDFYSDKNLKVNNYQTRDFGTKVNSASERKYATKESIFKNPFAVKTANTKTAPTKESPEANKLAASRDLPGGGRQYLGPEHKKMGTAYTAKDLANWRTGESIGYSDGSIEKGSSFKQLTVEDIRDLLNKSK